MHASDQTIILNPAEIEALTGYKAASKQLEVLHARGFVRAFRSRASGKVVLERAHYDAVTRGQFGPAAAKDAIAPRAPLPPNRAGFRAKFGNKRCP